MSFVASERVERWKAAWESLDLDRITGLYAPDASHSSRLVARLYPEIGSEAVSGAREIREYVTRGLLWFVKLEIEILSTLEDPARSAIEYRRRSNLDARPALVLERIDWDGSLIRSAVVYQF